MNNADLCVCVCVCVRNLHRSCAEDQNLATSCCRAESTDVKADCHTLTTAGLSFIVTLRQLRFVYSLTLYLFSRI